jgi:hypothetical protein
MFSRLRDQSKRSYVSLARLSQSATFFLSICSSVGLLLSDWCFTSCFKKRPKLESWTFQANTSNDPSIFISCTFHVLCSIYPICLHISIKTAAHLLYCPAYNISARNTEKTPFYCFCTIVAVDTYLFAKPLLNNGYCILVYSAVVA